MRKFAKTPILLIITISMLLLFAPLFRANDVYGETVSGTSGSCIWQFDGSTLIIFEGVMADWGEKPPWFEYSREIDSVVIDGHVELKTAYRMFSCMDKVTSLDLSNLDTSNVTTMKHMFNDCRSLKNLKLNGLDTSNVTDMADMFALCSSLTKLDLMGLDTSKVTDMEGMFYGCKALTKLDLTGLDASSVTNMMEMFSGCSSLTKLDLSSLDTSNVTNMSCLFYEMSSLNHLNLNNLNTSNVTSTGCMFYRCSSLTEIDLSGLDLSNVEYMNAMFHYCTSLESVNFSIDPDKDPNDVRLTAKLKEMGGMFFGCSSLESVDLNMIDTSNVSGMYSMFEGCTSLKKIDLSGFDASKADLYNMFSDCNSLKSMTIGKNFNTSANSFEWATFPRTMYDGKTGKKYAKGDEIPSIDENRTYCSDKPIERNYSGFDIDKDANKFTNNNKSFWPPGEDGTITRGDYLDDEIFETLTKHEEDQDVIDDIYEKQSEDGSMHGYCYGIVATMALLKNGVITSKELAGVAGKKYSDLGVPVNNETFGKSIRYYEVSQLLESGGGRQEGVYASSYDFDEDTHLFTRGIKKVLDEVIRLAERKEVLLLNYKKGEDEHTLAITGCSEYKDRYEMQLFDVNTVLFKVDKTEDGKGDAQIGEIYDKGFFTKMVIFKNVIKGITMQDSTVQGSTLQTTKYVARYKGDVQGKVVTMEYKIKDFEFLSVTNPRWIIRLDGGLPNHMEVKANMQTVKAKKLKKKAQKVAPLKVTGAQGSVSYKITGGKAKAKKALKINAKTGKITVKKKTKKGTYKVKVRVKAAGTYKYDPGSEYVNVTVKVK